jgi:hypothetical protein
MAVCMVVVGVSVCVCVCVCVCLCGWVNYIVIERYVFQAGAVKLHETM